MASRFVRAAFYQTSSPVQATARKTVLQAFQILNNFDIPVGIEFADAKVPADIPSATQWTSVTDMKDLVFYYRTMYNSEIRSIDLKAIDFARVTNENRNYCSDGFRTRTVGPVGRGDAYGATWTF